MKFFKKFFGAIGRWMKKHKILTVVLCIVVAAAIGAGVFLRSIPTSGKNVSYSFVRTTTLTKNSIEQTVDSTGTVASYVTSTVTYSSGGMGSSSAKVKSINFAVGDEVEIGDVIVELDTESINESIAEELENIEEKTNKNKENYNNAKSSYNDAVDAYNDAYDAYTEANEKYYDALNYYQLAQTSVSSFLKAYDTAYEKQESTGLIYNSKLSSYNTHLQNCENLKKEISNLEKALLEDGADVDSINEEFSKKTTELSELDSQTQTLLNETETAKANYESASAQTQNAQAALSSAKSACNYDAREKEYTQAESSLKSAQNQLDQAESKVDSTQASMEQAKETYDASGESTTLDSLYDQLDACTLKAQTKGKITSLNASVGGTLNGTVATIQDPDSLKISITIGESDINKVEIGMPCRITSDATDKVINGTLTQLDPVSGQSGNFGAEVTVTDTDTGLLIGMNASVEIIVSATDECFNVPIDAIGNDDDGKGDYVYRRIDGSGVDMTFEKVYVTTGESNDYYIEISSDELQIGDVIRSTSDLTQGIETTQTATNDQSGGAFSDIFSNLFGSQGGNMPSGGNFPSGNMPSGGGQRPSGGNMPSGGSQRPSGSNMPSGGSFPGGF